MAVDAESEEFSPQAGEMVAVHPAISLEMLNDPLDGSTPSQLALDRHGHTALLPHRENAQSGRS